jgi:hypothetical protein
MRNVLIKTMIFTLIIFASCYKSDIEMEKWDQQGNIKLGKKLDNPYTIANMQQAYENLKATKPYVPDLNISTTHYYLRFLPREEDEQKMIVLDSLIYLSEIPFDYEFEDCGYYFHDPSLPYKSSTWLYGVIPKNEIIPDIPNEIIAELFLPPSPDNLKKSYDEKWIAFYDELEHEALRITNNLDNDFDLKSSKSDSWFPKGRVTAWDDIANDYIGIQHVRVRVRRWFRTVSAITDAQGYYECTESFKRPAKYKIVWKRHNFTVATNELRLNNLPEAVSVSNSETNEYQLVLLALATIGVKRMQYIGPKKTGDWNVKLHKGTPYHFHAMIFKAASYYYYNDIDGLTRPPLNDDIGTQMKIIVQYHPADKYYEHAFHKPRARSFLDPAWIVINDNKIFTDELIGITIRQLAHATLFFMHKQRYIHNSDGLVYTWPLGVEYYLTRKLYPDYKLAYSRLDNTGIVEDLLDGFSLKRSNFQNFYRDFNPLEYYDSVSGYTITQLEAALAGAKTVEQWKNNIKTMYNNETEHKLDEAFSFWFSND